MALLSKKIFPQKFTDGGQSLEAEQNQLSEGHRGELWVQEAEAQSAEQQISGEQKHNSQLGTHKSEELERANRQIGQNTRLQRAASQIFV